MVISECSFQPAEDVSAHLEKLPRLERLIIALRYTEKMTDAEIGAVLSLDPITVRRIGDQVVRELQVYAR